MAPEIPFLKKLTLPSFSFQMFRGRPTRTAGIDFGSWSTKVVQLRYEGERAILETYGEILSAGYRKSKAIGGGGLLKYADEDIAAEIRDLITEAKISTEEAVFAVPAGSAFITAVPFTNISEREIAQAIPFEARKYVPIPIAETIFDWEIIESEENSILVLLVAVPREMVEKLKRVASLAKLNLRAVEVESFSSLRALLSRDPMPSAILNIGHQHTSLVIADKAKLKLSHNLDRGSYEITMALARGMNISEERAEEIKREIGLSEKIEERETVSVMTPLLETLFAEVERLISIYNRRSERKIQKIVLAGGGSNLKGLVDFASTKLGIEVARANPFGRLVVPAFMQPLLRQIGPSFTVAVGLALREISMR